jgi:hypothetical protein
LDLRSSSVSKVLKTAGIFGFGYGLFKSARELTFRNRPKKLIATSLINMVGKQATRCANAGASITLMYCFLKKIINFVFEEEIQGLSPLQKQFFYGFITGALYKSTRGVKPMLLSGTLTAVACAILQESYGWYTERNSKKNKV